MPSPALVLAEDKFVEFRKYLHRVGFKFEERPHQVFLARSESLVVSLYASGKVVIAGTDRQLEKEVLWFLSKLGAIGETLPDKLQKVAGRTRIGTDEAGKGDYFGPLVVAGVLLRPEIERSLTVLGVRDSKELTDSRAIELSGKLRKILGRGNWELIRIFPDKYNELYEKMGNLNRILAWAHARVIEDLVKAHADCRLVVVDEFSARSLEAALAGRGREVELVQSVRGERDTAVACASVLARAGFLDGLEMLGGEYGTSFPKGATAVVGPARDFVRKHGEKCLAKVAKLHFQTTQKVLGP